MGIRPLNGLDLIALLAVVWLLAIPWIRRGRRPRRRPQSTDAAWPLSRCHGVVTRSNNTNVRNSRNLS